MITTLRDLSCLPKTKQQNRLLRESPCIYVYLCIYKLIHRKGGNIRSEKENVLIVLPTLVLTL